MAYNRIATQAEIRQGTSPDTIVSPKLLYENVWYFSGSTVDSEKSFGTTTNFEIPFIQNNVEIMRLTATGLGIGTGTGVNNKLEVDSGVANTSGVRLTNLTSASPTGAGGAIGVDANGDIVRISSVAEAISLLYLSGDTGNAQPLSNNDVIRLSGGTGISTFTIATDTVSFNLNAGLDLLNDVVITSVTEEDILQYVGGQWVNVPFPSGAVGGATNGLQLISTNVGLGGDLIQDTTIHNGAYDLIFLQTGSGKIGIANSLPLSALDNDSSISSGRIRTVTGTTTLLDTDFTLLVNNSGNVSVNLPTSASAERREYIIKKISENTNTVTVDPDGSELIDGQATYVITSSYNSIKIKSNGTSWYIV